MSDPAVESSAAGTSDPARYLPALLLLFAGSGLAALIYEIVWYQELQLAIGSTATSLGVLLATYMGGLSLGSWLLPRWFAGKRAHLHPLKAYALIELAIGLLGLAELVLIPLIDKAYVAGSQGGAGENPLLGTVLRAVFCAIALLPPTVLMGASLPAIARWARGSARGASWWGLLYGVNIAGAVAGSLFAGFFLLRVYDVVIATVVAFAINALVGVLSLILAARAPASAEPEVIATSAATPEPQAPDNSRWWRLVAIGLSGAVSMGAQVVWTRICGLMLGGTVYVFSIILAVFLTGLGIGAALGARLGRRRNAQMLMGLSQVFAALGLAWTAWQLGASIPFWPVEPLSNSSALSIFQIDLVRVIWAIFPATVFWGAAVPLSFAAAVQEAGDGDPSRTVARVYAANTLGAIAGALLVSLVLTPVIGSARTEQVLLATSAIAAMAAFGPLVLGSGAGWKPWAGVVAAGAAAVILTPSLPPIPGELIAYGRRTAQYVGQFDVLEQHEGRNSSIAVTRWADGTTQFHVQGKVEASDNPSDMALQRMLGYLPAMFIQPKSVLIVGFGAGVTAGTFTAYPDIQRIKICEMEPEIPPTTTKWFAAQNHNVLHDRRTDITYDDARHFIRTTREKFDVVTSDPIHPFVKGSASLYSEQYFAMMRDHLNPGGVATQWIPLYESDFATVKSEIATFMKVFPYAEVFKNNDISNQGYDIVLVGHVQPLTFDPQAAQARLSPQMVQDMTQSGLGGPQDLYGRYVADKPGLKDWLADAQINTDRDLRLQYLAGFALNRYLANDIYQEMAKRSTAPVGIRTAPSPVAATYTLTAAAP